jgi:hypothetical protein
MLRTTFYVALTRAGGREMTQKDKDRLSKLREMREKVKVTSVFEVDKKTAERIIAGSDDTENRNVSPKCVEKYATDMKEGLWGLTSDPIALDGKLFVSDILNGRTRLGAVINSDSVQVFELWENCPKEFQQHFDIGRSRSASDIAGLKYPTRREEFKNPVMSLANRVLVAMQTHYNTWPSPTQTLAFAVKYREELNYIVNEVFQGRREGGITRAAVLAPFFVALMCDVSRTRLKQGGAYLLDGVPVDASEDKGLMIVRDFLLRDSVGTTVSNGKKGIHKRIYGVVEMGLSLYLRHDNPKSPKTVLQNSVEVWQPVIDKLNS